MEASRSAHGDQPLPRQMPGRRWPGDCIAGWALVTGVGVLVLAVLLPIETIPTDRAGVQPRASIFQLHGAVVLLPSAVPLLVAALVTAVLYAGREGRRNWTLPVAWVLSIALLCAAVAGFLTFLIGVFVIPTGVLLTVATSLAQDARRR
ncbi:hypothetical protein GA0115240_117728 [Streptomyces sp. DvalAA-14]|uniref:hypothetical protein n=1 Tax=unclassified Streptomyces TaxID=2593676 RepID=UPI00081B9A62|nr:MULTISPECIES: hypothetical protein [unclassified Streptomyces]MYS20231.1 hypothetical protein [Streptomyces sp. SID4948]SCD64017.1 hypothetical protein GA0115240_117728 [Streptomyces sp. DvalAA-14]